MRKSIYTPLFLLMLFFLPIFGKAADFVNLTPRPKWMSQQQGTYTLPERLTVGGEALGDSITLEIAKFVADFNRAASGVQAVATENAADAAIQLLLNQKLRTSLGEEGYKLTVSRKGVTIESGTQKGFYYGFVSLKKMLPACIMAGVKDSKVTTYTLPYVSITDAPRYKYRGFMLDVSRHFFSAKQIKRIIDVMAAYKMNAFHFHLTDDQGWRWEVKQYPNLTRIGSVAANTYLTAMYHGAYWTNEQYGPYFYTQEELRDIVAYAAERHIEIIPEIDMPGHFVAAMASYPEFSCNPDNPPTVWTHGGISTHILNVANPRSVQFAKNILTELMDIFPSKTIHIGGDECPTSAWENNALCKALYNKLGLKSYRQLQSHFIKEMNEHVKARGRKLAVWNEAITANGTDLDIMKATGATVYCWIGAAEAAKKAAQLKLPHIYTPQRPYYINRQAGNEPWEISLPGDGSDHLKAVYNHAPVSNAYTRGVQATFWTEHVGNDDLLEYLTFPRLIAVAEAGWTPQSLRNFNNFAERVRADTVMLNYNNYQYGRHFLNTNPSPIPPIDDTPPAVIPENGKTYIVRCAIDRFKGTAISDNGKSQHPMHTTDSRANIGWAATEVTPYDPATRQLKLRLKNVTTGRSIGNAASNIQGTLGFPLSMGNATPLTLSYNPAHKDFTISVSNKNLFPVPHQSPALPGIVSAGNKEGLGNAVRPQGAAWQLIPARTITYVCTDTENKELGKVKEIIAQGDITLTPPSFAGYKLKTQLPDNVSPTEDATFNLSYERVSNLVYLSCEDKHGALLRRDTIHVPIGTAADIKVPEIPYYTAVDVPTEALTQTPKADTHIVIVYSTEAYSGVKALAEPVSRLEDGIGLVIYDTSSNNPERAGYRNLNPSTLQIMRGNLTFGEADPYFTWVFEKSGAKWKIKNEVVNKYIPEMKRSGSIIVSKTPGSFQFTLNADKETWKVQGSNGLYWDGAENSMTGWHTYGHPYRLHRYFAAPYFGVTLLAVSGDDNSTLDQEFHLVPAGHSFTFVAPLIAGKELRSIENADDLKSVSKHTTVRCLYSAPNAISSPLVEQSAHQTLHDLSGRRVAPSRAGLYIVNGKKVLLK